MSTNKFPSSTVDRGLAVAAAVFCLSAFPVQGQTIDIPDPELVKAINRGLFRPPNSPIPITAADMARLQFLMVQLGNFRDPPITSLEGLQFATNLTAVDFFSLRLTLRDAPFVSPPYTPIDLPENGLAPLSALPRLNSLSFYECKLPSAVLPSGLTSLRSLWIESCGTTNLTIPDSVSNLVSLRVIGNNIDFSVPGVLPADRSRLESLELGDLELADLSWIDSLQGLTTLKLANLGLTNLALSDATFRRLTTFGLSRNPQLKDLSFLSRLESIETLVLISNSLTSVALPRNFLKLKSLDLSDNLLSLLDLPQPPPPLQNLDLSGNPLADTSFIRYLPGLGSLTINSNPVPFQVILPPGMTNLGSLVFWSSRLTNLVLAPGLSNLSYLNLHGTELQELNIPPGASNLVYCDFSFSGLGRLTIAEPLPRIENFYAQECELTDASFLDRITAVRTIDLQGNRLSDIGLSRGFTNLQFLYLRGNQLTNISLPDDLASLFYLGLGYNRFETLRIPRGLDSLFTLDVAEDPLLSLLLPADFHPSESLEIDGFPVGRLSFYPVLDIVRSNHSAEVSWLGGILQTRDDLGRGEWTDMPEETSPLSFSTGSPMKWFRVVGN